VCRPGRDGARPSNERCSVRLPARERFRSPQRNCGLALGQRTLQPPFVISSPAETSLIIRS